MKVAQSSENQAAFNQMEEVKMEQLEPQAEDNVDLIPEQEEEKMMVEDLQPRGEQSPEVTENQNHLTEAEAMQNNN